MTPSELLKNQSLDDNKRTAQLPLGVHIKDQFPIFKNQTELIYLDSAATSQKPVRVLEAMDHYIRTFNASPNRGAHVLSVETTILYEKARDTVRRFIGARRVEEIVFTKNATESLNILAYSFGLQHVKKGQKIVLSITNHHSNVLPWQMVAKVTGAELSYMYVDEEGRHIESELDKIDENTAIVAFPVISNGIGTLHDFRSIIAKAQTVGAVTIVDAAQAVGHIPLDVAQLDCDFLIFSGHKLFAPQGVGVLYGKYSQLDRLTPFLRGGDMIEYVEEQQATFAPLPNRLEAGTQNVSSVIGLAEAIRFIESIGLDVIHQHEEQLTRVCYEALNKRPYVTVHGPKSIRDRGSLITFTVDGIHPHDIASILDEQHIAIRAGHHCCQPLMNYMQTGATCRVSFSVFNTEEDVESLIIALEKAREVFGLA